MVSPQCDVTSMWTWLGPIRRLTCILCFNSPGPNAQSMAINSNTNMSAEIVVIWGLFIDSHVYLILNGRHTPFGTHMRASSRTHKQQQEGICFRPNSRFLTNLHRHTHNHTHFATAQPVYLYYHIYIDIYLTVVGGRVGE